MKIIKELAKDSKCEKVDVEKYRGIILHRCGVDLKWGHELGFDAESIIHAFTSKETKFPGAAKATGYQMPYHFLIGGSFGPDEFDGKIWQTLPLEELGPHARGASGNYIGIGLIGDFRERNGTSLKQWHAAIDLCALILGGIERRTCDVQGHGEHRETHDGSKAPGEPNACPGDYWDMGGFRSDLKALRKDVSRSEFHIAGGTVFCEPADSGTDDY